MIKTISPYRTTVTCFHQKQQEVVDTYDSSEYILSIASSSNNNSTSPPSSSSSNLVAAALSNQSIIIYDTNIGQIIQRIECAHDGPISEVQFFPREYTSSNDQSLIISASQDGTIKIWNVQHHQQQTVISSNSVAIKTMKLEFPNEQALSLSLGYGGTLAAVGTDKARISFFDLRRNNNSNTSMPSGTLMGSYVDAHTEEVTKVQFQTIPTQTSSSQATEMKTILASSSEDGLISIHDPSQSNEEDALLSILNINTPLRNIGFFGPNYEGIFALTGNESLSVHDWDSAQLVSNVHGMELRGVLCTAVDRLVGKKMNDMSSDATMSDGMNNTIDYLIGCTWSDLSTSTTSPSSSPALYLLAGNNQGDGYIFRMDVNQITPVIHLKGGHRGCIRDFCWSSNRLITGGEDARLCEWDLTGNSSVSSSLGTVGGTSGWNRSHNDSVGGGPVSGRSVVKGISEDGKKKKKFGSPY